MKSSKHAFVAFATVGLLSSCQSNVQGPDTIDPGTISARSATEADIVVAPVGIVRNVEAQTLTLQFSLTPNEPWALSQVSHFWVGTGPTNPGPSLCNVRTSERSTTLALPSMMGSRYARLGGTTFVVHPMVTTVPNPMLTSQDALFPMSINRPSSLRKGDGLFPNECMVSNNSAYKLCMQPDGNLVETDASGTVLWSTGKAGGGASTLLLSATGKLSTRLASGTETWSSTNTGWTSFTLTDSGSLMLYKSGIWPRISYLFMK